MDTTTVIAGMGVLIAALFWIVTQWNVIRVGRQLKAVQAEAREHADQVINQAFQTMGTLMDTKISQIRIPEIPEVEDIDFTQAIDTIEARMRGALAEQGELLKAQVLESSKASFMAMQSGLTRGLHRELKEFEGPLDELAENYIAEAAATMNPTDALMAQIVNQDVSDKFARDQPLATTAFRVGKMAIVQQLQAMRGAQQGISTQKSVGTAVKASPYGD
jgi:hypothetical protein